MTTVKIATIIKPVRYKDYDVELKPGMKIQLLDYGLVDYVFYIGNGINRLRLFIPKEWNGVRYTIEEISLSEYLERTMF